MGIRRLVIEGVKEFSCYEPDCFFPASSHHNDDGNIGLDRRRGAGNFQDARRHFPAFRHAADLCHPELQPHEPRPDGGVDRQSIRVELQSRPSCPPFSHPAHDQSQRHHHQHYTLHRTNPLPDKPAGARIHSTNRETQFICSNKAGHKVETGFAHCFCVFRHFFQSSWVASAIASAAFSSQWECRTCKSARITDFA